MAQLVTKNTPLTHFKLKRRPLAKKLQRNCLFPFTPRVLLKFACFLIFGSLVFWFNVFLMAA